MSQTSLEILFDKFEIINCLKKDEQTAVYLANHIYLGKKIILKTLDTSDLPDNTILERFKREAKILAKLNNENIIKVLDFGTYNNFFYISFEHFESVTLREIIKNKNLSDEQKFNLLTQLLKALAVAHQNRIIHRDIKPENILVNTELELKIADFGLALVVNDINITNSSSIVGTPGYMAPEQIHGEKTQQTDLFSAGLVAYELFTGHNPILGENVTSTINNILNIDEDNINRALEKFPQNVRTSITSMLHKDPAQRAKTAGEVLKYLGTDTKDVKITQRNYIKNNRKKIFIYSAAFILVIISVFLINNTFLKKSNVNASAKSKTGMNQSPVANIYPNNNEGNTFPKTDKNNKDNNTSVNKMSTHASILKGKLSINCYPWANVFIDKKKIDMTPLNISIGSGRHIIELVHPDFPPLFKTIKVTAGDSEAININFNDITGKLEFNIYPWGNIYVNHKLIGTSPLRKPVVLYPGKYLVTIKNKNYRTVTKEVTITAKKTEVMDLNLEKTLE